MFLLEVAVKSFAMPASLAFTAMSLAMAAEPALEMQRMASPRYLELSPDGSRVWYKLGADWWEMATSANARPKRTSHTQPPQETMPLSAITQVRRQKEKTSPDGKRVAYLGAERPYGPTLLMVASSEPAAAPKAVSRMPVNAFFWASDSQSLWVLGTDGADAPIGRLTIDGTFSKISQGAAIRSGLTAAGDMLAWTQSDGKHLGSIWLRDRAGQVRVLVEPNPQAAQYNPGTQDVVHWKNGHDEKLVGILAKPAAGGPFPLIVDPYSVWQNRYLGAPAWGNYEFVRQGFAVFFPDHRAAHAFAENMFGEAYVGSSKSRDPVDVLTDDVMSGVQELIRRGVADPNQLYLYSSSSGASSIDQLLTTTHVFRAAVAHAGVADWLWYYETRHKVGDETIPGFLGGRTPADSMDLYKSISVYYHVDQIRTPLLLVVGDQDQPRYDETRRFYDALVKAGAPVKLVVYPGQGHQITSAELGVKHIRQALDFFRSAPAQAK